jgi:hypothetical protein
MSRTLSEHERKTYLPVIQEGLKTQSINKSDKEIEDALNNYMSTAEQTPENYQDLNQEELTTKIADEVIQRLTPKGGRRPKSSKKRATRRRRSSKRKSRKMNKRRK